MSSEDGGKRKETQNNALQPTDDRGDLVSRYVSAIIE